LQKTTVSQDRLKAEKAKLKKTAAELAREMAERKLAGSGRGGMKRIFAR
jgi:hypothetical protein